MPLPIQTSVGSENQEPIPFSVLSLSDPVFKTMIQTRDILIKELSDAALDMIK